VGRSQVALCLSCGMPWAGESDVCPGCHATHVARVYGDAVVEFPAHSLPCPRCGRDEKPIVFRTWALEAGFFVWCRDGRVSAYLCPDCARLQTTKALVFTGLLGWLSFPGWIFFAWRATYFNWRAIWTHPAEPLRWGAMPAQALIDDMRRAQQRAEAFESADEGLFAASPLEGLSHNERDAVLSAAGLYELLAVEPSASREEIRSAYAACARATHPDLHSNNPASTEQMILLNSAWSVLGDERTRAAYDWLQRQKASAL